MTSLDGGSGDRAAELGREVVARLRAAYEAHADRERALGAAAYLRDQFAFFGLPTPLRRRLTSAALQGLPTPNEADLAAVSRALWAEPERELQYAACDYVRRYVRVAGPPFLAVVGELVTAKSWWDTVDGLATHAAGPLVQAHPRLAAVMDAWSADENIWLVRSAILQQLTYKHATDADRLFAYCRAHAGDREFFVRKAIGWALRTYAATDPDAVAAFVQATPTLSPLSVREATRGIERARG